MYEMKQTNNLDARNKILFIWPKNNASMIKNKVFENEKFEMIFFRIFKWLKIGYSTQ